MESDLDSLIRRVLDRIKNKDFSVAFFADVAALVVYLLNRGPDDKTVALDLTPLGRTFDKLKARRLWAEDATTVETAKDHGNIHRRDSTDSVRLENTVTFVAPKFSFTEIVLE